MFLVCIIIFLIILALLISFYENRHFVVTNYKIRTKYFNGEKVKAVFISDLHDCTYGNENIKLLSAIDALSPDIVFLGGDIFNGIRNKKNVNAKGFLMQLGSKYKCFYALGNHEFRFYLYPDEFPQAKEKFEALLRQSGITLLDNRTEKFIVGEKEICVSGISIERRFYKRRKADKMPENYVESVLGERNKNAFNVLLAHNPKYLREYAAYGADLVLSGHYHGGIMRIFKQGMVSPDFRILPRYSYGKYTINESTMIISGGLGVHTIPFRIFNKPEIVMLEFEGK